LDLAAVDLLAGDLGQLRGDIGGRDRAEEPSLFADAGVNLQADAVDLRCEVSHLLLELRDAAPLGFLPLFDLLDHPRRRDPREALGNQVVAGEAVLHVLDRADLAELRHVLRQHNLHLIPRLSDCFSRRTPCPVIFGARESQRERGLARNRCTDAPPRVASSIPVSFVAADSAAETFPPVPRGLSSAALRKESLPPASDRLPPRSEPRATPIPVEDGFTFEQVVETMLASGQLARPPQRYGRAPQTIPRCREVRTTWISGLAEPLAECLTMAYRLLS